MNHKTISIMPRKEQY